MPAAIEVITDTNVIAYSVLQTREFVDEVQPFWEQVTQAAAPVHWQAEVANLIWIATRHRLLTPAAALERLGFAERLPVASASIVLLWQGAALRSLETGLAVYDTLFIELAAQHKCRLVTFDAQVLRAYPKLACRPRAWRA